MNVVLIGPPGVGKGTQAESLCLRFGLVHIATGDLLRAAIRARSPLGLEIEPIMKSGRLVPDTMVSRVVRERMEENIASGKASFLFDGFPRDKAQADMLDSMLAALNLSLDHVVCLNAGEETILLRLAGRRVCGNCGATYHVKFKPPKENGRCDGCGERSLLRRADDNEETIRERLRVYAREAQPLVERYASRGILAPISAEGGSEETFELIAGSLEEAAGAPSPPRA